MVFIFLLLFWFVCFVYVLLLHILSPKECVAPLYFVLINFPFVVVVVIPPNFVSLFCITIVQKKSVV